MEKEKSGLRGLLPVADEEADHLCLWPSVQKSSVVLEDGNQVPKELLCRLAWRCQLDCHGLDLDVNQPAKRKQLCLHETKCIGYSNVVDLFSPEYHSLCRSQLKFYGFMLIYIIKINI